MSQHAVSSSRKVAFLAKLEAVSPPNALKTLPADPEAKNIPQDIQDLLQLGNPTNSLQLSQEKYTCETEKDGLVDFQVGIPGQIPRCK